MFDFCTFLSKLDTILLRIKLTKLMNVHDKSIYLSYLSIYMYLSVYTAKKAYLT